MRKRIGCAPGPSARAASRRQLHRERHPARLGRRELDLGPSARGRARRAPRPSMRKRCASLGGVHQLHPVDVLDAAVLDQARQRAAVAHDVDLERRAQRPGSRRTPTAISDQHRAVDQHARPQHARATSGAGVQRLLHAVLRGVADQARAESSILSITVVAGVDAGGAADALVLQALADVDAGRADLHAQRAVDAVALADALRVDAAPARAARLAARGVVADDRACRGRTSRSGSARRDTCTCRPARACSRRCRRSRSRRTASRTSPTARAPSARRPRPTSACAGVK